jgi:actin-related protein
LLLSAVLLTGCAVTDWDAIEGLMDYSFRKWLQIDTREHPLMITDPNYNTHDRYRTASLMIVWPVAD